MASPNDDFDDDLSDDPFAFPPTSRGGGFGAPRGGVTPRRGFASPSSLPKSQLDILREEVEQAKQATDKLRAQLTEKQSDMEELKQKREEMERAEKNIQKMLSGKFPERFQSGGGVDLGCFGEEKISAKNEYANMEAEKETLTRALAESEGLEAKKKQALEAFLEEEERKKNNEKESLQSGSNDESKEENFFVGIKKYWEMLSHDQKSEVLDARKDIERMLGNEVSRAKLMGWFVGQFGGEMDAQQKKDIELVKNPRETALLLTLSAHRSGKLTDLISL